MHVRLTYFNTLKCPFRLRFMKDVKYDTSLFQTLHLNEYLQNHNE